MAASSDPLVDYVTGHSQGTGGTDSTPPGQGTGTSGTADPELRVLEQQRGELDNNRYRLIQERTKAAAVLNQNGVSNEDYADAKAKVTELDTQIKNYDAEIRSYDQQIAKVKGSVAQREADARTKPKPMTPQETAALQVETQRQIAQNTHDINNPAKKPYDPNNDADLQRYYLEREAAKGDREAAAALAQGNFDLAKQRLGFEQSKADESNRQFEQTGRRQDQKQQSDTYLSLLNNVGGNQRSNNESLMAKAQAELQREIAKGNIDAGNAERKLQRYTLALKYAEQYGLDKDYKKGFEPGGAMWSAYNAAGRHFDSEPFRQTKVNPFQMAGIGNDLNLPDTQFNAPALPTLPTLDINQQQQQATQAMQNAPVFNQAQQGPPAPAQAPMQQPYQSPTPTAVPPTGGFNDAGGAGLLAQWRQQRIQSGQNPDDFQAFLEHLRAIGVAA